MKIISIHFLLMGLFFSSIGLSKELSDTIRKDPKPVFGYRFTINGDFDGNGKKEKLTEHYFSTLTNKETNKFYDSLDEYDQFVELTVKKDPLSFVSSQDPLIDTLHISTGGQLLGLLYLKNEGDLDGDGGDEVSYVVDWADWSNCNTWHIVSYKKKKWHELYSFPIWETQLPDLPQTFTHHGLFGVEDVIINTTDGAVNKQLEKELKAFKGLVKKISTHKIKVTYLNSEPEVTTKIVDLRKVKHANK